MGRAVFGSSILLLLAARGFACSASRPGDVAQGGHSASVGSGGTLSTSDGGKWPDGGPKSGGAGGTSGATGGSAGTGGSAAVGGSGAGGGPSGGSGGVTATEVCNNQDDDGDGSVDESLTESCTTACGTGTQSCSAGQWSACSAGMPKSCMNYATCQNESKCVSSCAGAPSESCNLKDDDCDGNCDDAANCRVGVHRSYSNATGEHFYTKSLGEAGCCGFTVEYQNYFYLYSSSTPGLVPFYRCALNIGYHFYTTSSNCEGAAGTNEGELGYIATSPTCGATPLYRLAHANGDHFYTTSAAERDSAIGMGYINETPAGYVWTGP